MAIKKLALLIPFLLAGNAWADVVEHCPRIDDIKEHGGKGNYTAKTVSGEGQWYSTSSWGSGEVRNFETARFTPREEAKAIGGVIVGELRRCSYRLKDGNALELFFKNPGTFVTVRAGNADDVWQDYYGVAYDCDDSDPTKCTFVELPKAKKG